MAGGYDAARSLSPLLRTRGEMMGTDGAGEGEDEEPRSGTRGLGFVQRAGAFLVRVHAVGAGGALTITMRRTWGA